MTVQSYPLPNFEKLPEVEKRLAEGNTVAIVPTKVGYIVAAVDRNGLERKFELKERPLNKPGVVLASVLEQFYEIAEVNDTFNRELIEQIYATGALCGFILPWNKKAMEHYVPEDLQELVQDKKGTSCFVYNHGIYTEVLANNMLRNHELIVFASSANPSGQGNRGRFKGIGEKIINGADIVIEADDYVKAQQPSKDEGSRYEQGVMVSLVTENPTVIRTGLDIGTIVSVMAEVCGRKRAFDFRPGAYY